MIKQPHYVYKSKPSIEKKKKKTLSLDGEKLMPAVGAECCFSHETLIVFQKIYTVNLKISIWNNEDKNKRSKKETIPAEGDNY